MVKGIHPSGRRDHNGGEADVFVGFRIVDINKVHNAMSEQKQVPSQSDKFKQAAREAECDEDEARWEQKLKKVVRAKPAA